MPSPDYLTIAIGLAAALLGWMGKALWGTKPDMSKVTQELDRRFAEFMAEDQERDLLMISVLKAEIQGLKDIRQADHELLADIHKLLLHRYNGPR